jgi:hypothetical protein
MLDRLRIAYLLTHEKPPCATREKLREWVLERQNGRIDGTFVSDAMELPASMDLATLEVGRIGNMTIGSATFCSKTPAGEPLEVLLYYHCDPFEAPARWGWRPSRQSLPDLDIRVPDALLFSEW